MAEEEDWRARFVENARAASKFLRRVPRLAQSVLRIFLLKILMIWANFGEILGILVHIDFKILKKVL